MDRARGPAVRLQINSNNSGDVGQAEIENGPLVGFAFRPDLPSKFMDNPLDQGKPDSGPLELRFAVEPLKCAEQPCVIAHLESDSIVADVIDN